MSRPPTTTNPRKITKLPVGDLRNDISFISLRNNQLRVALHAHNDDAEDVLCAQVRASARRASCDSEESRCRGFRRNDPRRIHYGRVIDMLADADGQTLRLESQGYNRLGIVGTSLGSCYAFIAASHDPRIHVAAFNHASTYFADVVWYGQSTRHIREALQVALDVENLRRVFRAVSPMVYFDKRSEERRVGKECRSRW